MPIPPLRNFPLKALLLLLALALIGLPPDPASARKKKRRGPPPIYVSNDAVPFVTPPGQSCGSAAFPCRSIQEGVIAAPPGGSVLVGPGIYGDFDGIRGTVGSGERSHCTSRGCALIVVDEGVRVISSEGAARTIINVKDVGLSAAAVVVADGHFGSPGQGFTVKDFTRRGITPGAGIHCGKGSASGNVMIGNRIGMILEACRGSDNVAIENSAVGFVLAEVRPDQVAPYLANSFAVANGGAGFSVESARAQLVSSQGIANGNGVLIPAGTYEGRPARADGAVLKGNLALANTSHGFGLLDNGSQGVVYESNTAAANGTPSQTSGSGEGFLVRGSGSIVVGNTAVANGHHGIAVEGSGHDVIRNQAIGNYTYGIGWSASGGRVDRNASYANRICQIHDPAFRLSAATFGYWGSATGPVGDVPTCKVPSLDPLAASPQEALGTNAKKKKKKRKRKKKNHSAKGGSTWPVR